MKILAVTGSPKVHCNTFRLVSTVENRLKERGWCRFEYIFLDDATSAMAGMICLSGQGRASVPDQGCDYEYRKKNGWLDKETAYYYPVRVNQVKVALARCLSPLPSTFI